MLQNSKAEASEPESLNIADSAEDFWMCQIAGKAPIWLKLGDWLPCAQCGVPGEAGSKIRLRDSPGKFTICPTFEAKHFQRHSDRITEKGNSIRSHGMSFVYIRSCDDLDVSPTSHFDLFLISIYFNPQNNLRNVFSRCCIACWFVCSCCLRAVLF